MRMVCEAQDSEPGFFRRECLKSAQHESEYDYEQHEPSHKTTSEMNYALFLI
jgi:hypothetical protein